MTIGNDTRSPEQGPIPFIKNLAQSIVACAKDTDVEPGDNLYRMEKAAEAIIAMARNGRDQHDPSFNDLREMLSDFIVRLCGADDALALVIDKLETADPPELDGNGQLRGIETLIMVRTEVERLSNEIVDACEIIERLKRLHPDENSLEGQIVTALGQVDFDGLEDKAHDRIFGALRAVLDLIETQQPAA